MGYKIAVASRDGANIDLSFSGAYKFDIYEVKGREYHLIEKREYVLPEDAVPEQLNNAGNISTAKDTINNGSCGSKNGCGISSGCGTGGGCGSVSGTFPKVQLISDCRCVICKKIGFQVQKQFEKLAIISFDVDCTVEEALTKITTYFEMIDNHQSLRGIQNKER